MRIPIKDQLRVVESISALLMLIMLICYLLPATVLGFFMGGRMIRDEQSRTEAALPGDFAADNEPDEAIPAMIARLDAGRGASSEGGTFTGGGPSAGDRG